MSENKRYYWLKLRDDFFSSKRMKKLRKMPDGDTYTVIYLKILLLAMKTDGVLTFTGLEDDFAGELALEIDEDPDDVRTVLEFLFFCGLVGSTDNVSFFFTDAVENVGSENASAQRVREYRKKQQALQCNTDVTQVKPICSAEKEIREEIRDREEIREETREEAREETREEAREETREEASEETREETREETDTREREEKKNPARKIYGEYSNVFLSDEELEKWKTECAEWSEYIEKLSGYIASTGKKYENHLATLRSWHSRDKPSGKAVRHASYDLDEAVRQSLFAPLKYERKRTKSP